jgi:hypothetical protein
MGEVVHFAKLIGNEFVVISTKNLQGTSLVIYDNKRTIFEMSEAALIKDGKKAKKVE